MAGARRDVPDRAAPAHDAKPARGPKPAARGTPSRPAAAGLLRLQGLAGNAAVSGLLTAQRDTATCPAPPVAPPGVTPAEDPKFQSLKKDVAAGARSAKAHPPVAGEVKRAQDAAVAPPDDKEAQAKAAKAGKMDGAKPAGFDKAGFIAAVNAAIAKQAPKNLDEADKFATSGKADQIKSEVMGNVTQGKDASAKDVTDKTKEPPDPSRAVEKPVTPLPPQAPPPVLAAPDPRKAVPDKAPAEQTDLRADQCETDAKMADAGVTDEQLAKSNEPELTGALDAKKEGEAHTATAPAAVRAGEAQQLGAATTNAAGVADAGLTAMVGAHATTGQHAAGAKSDTKGKDEQERARHVAKIKELVDRTEADVTKILDGIDAGVTQRFETGEREAKSAFTADHQARMKRYKDERYSGLTGAARWTYDLFAGLPAEANTIFLDAKKVYEQKMQQVIAAIADFVGEQLTAAKTRIATGRTEVESYLSTQVPAAQRKLVGEASKELTDRFSKLESDVDDKQKSVVDDLAQKYVEARNAVDEEIKNLQAENKGLWAKAKEAVAGAIETILKLKDMLLGVLARAANAIELIIKDPIGFLGNLVNAVKTGVMNFAANIVEHLKAGLKAWLLGNLASAGIEIPETFDLKGILKLILSILGLTWANVRTRILKFIPEPVLKALETTFEVVGILVSQGLPGLWKWVLEKLGDIKEMVLGQIREFVITKIITAGITWLISLLNPASAFIKACKAIYDIVMFFVEKAAQIKEFVDSVLDSVESIARGGAGAVAGLVEKALAKAVPMVIGMLAALLGVGGISEKIKSVLETIQKPVNKVIDSVVGTIVKAGKSLWSKLKRGGRAVASGVRRLKDAFLAKLMGKHSVSMKGNSHSVFLEVQGGKHVVMMASTKDRLVRKVHKALASDAVKQHPELVGHLEGVQKTVAQYEADIVKYKFEEPDTRKANQLEAALEAYSGQMISQLAAIGQVMDIDVLSGGKYVLDDHVHPDYQRTIRQTFYGSSGDYEHHRAAKRQEAINARLARYPDPTVHPDKFWCPGYPGGSRAPHLAPLSILQLDHKVGAATHWASGVGPRWPEPGRNATQAARTQFFVDGSNIEALCRACNAAKQSGGDHYDTVVGPNFSGPGGLR
jgi:hypothetical protein